MTTTVVNIYKDDYDVYIGRAGKGQDGYFGNPVRVGNKCPECGEIHKTKGSTLFCYQKYFFRRLAEDEQFTIRIQELKDKRLGCFCISRSDIPSPVCCHGQIIARYLDCPEAPRTF